MKVYKHEHKYQNAYHIQAATICQTPFFATWLKIEPGASSFSHAHHEYEMFIVKEGEVAFSNSIQRKNLFPGDAILFKPFEQHQLTNCSDKQEALILSLVWEDRQASLVPDHESLYNFDGADFVASEAIRRSAEDEGNLDKLSSPSTKPGGKRCPSKSKDFRGQALVSHSLKNKNENVEYLITSTPPTPNGDLHIGHVSGPYLRADIVKRYYQSKNYSVSHILNTDDFQSYVLHKCPKDPCQIAATYANKIQSSLSLMQIEPDIFYQSSKNRPEAEAIKNLFRQLIAKKHITQKNQETLFCSSCNRYLYEVYVTGQCPYCDKTTRGTLCESCGWVNDCQQLKHALCDCGQQPTAKLQLRYYFPLEPFRERLQLYYSTLQLPPHVIAFIENIFCSKLPDMPVSHQNTWGIALCNREIISAWFEMGLRHALQVTNHLKNDKELILFQFFGFDNSFFNLILFPSIFIALELEKHLPKKVVMNPFYHLEGQKFSTSRRHAIWAKDLAERYPADLIRWHLCANGPEWQAENFSVEGFIQSAHSFITTLQLWIAKIDSALFSFHGMAPETGLWNEAHKIFYHKLSVTDAHIASCYEQVQLRDVCREIDRFVHDASLFFQQHELLKQFPSQHDQWRTTVALQTYALGHFARWLLPIMPKLGQNLADRLHLDPASDTINIGFKKSLCPIEPLGKILDEHQCFD